MDEARSRIEQMVCDEIGGAQVDWIVVREDIGYEGDSILRIDVVLKSLQNFDAARAAGLARKLQSSFAREQKEFGFPVISYLSKADGERLQAAAG